MARGEGASKLSFFLSLFDPFTYMKFTESAEEVGKAAKEDP